MPTRVKVCDYIISIVAAAGTACAGRGRLSSETKIMNVSVQCCVEFGDIW